MNLGIKQQGKLSHLNYGQKVTETDFFLSLSLSQSYGLLSHCL